MEADVEELLVDDVEELLLDDVDELRVDDVDLVDVEVPVVDPERVDDDVGLVDVDELRLLVDVVCEVDDDDDDVAGRHLGA